MSELTKAQLAFNAIVAERTDAFNAVYDAIDRLNDATVAARAIDQGSSDALRFATYKLMAFNA